VNFVSTVVRDSIVWTEFSMIGSLLGMARLDTAVLVYLKLYPFVLSGCDQGMGNTPDIMSSFSRNWSFGIWLTNVTMSIVRPFETGILMMFGHHKESSHVIF
jgi:hypothetical protein